MIQCPECGGDGYAENNCDKCGKCGGERTILDRRSPSASDRAVERIKAHLHQHLSPFEAWGAVEVGKGVMAREIMDIIREEASNEP